MTYEGMYLTYSVRAKKLSFRKRSMESKTFLVIGQVNEGVVNSQPVTYWLAKIEAQKNQVVRT